MTAVPTREQLSDQLERHLITGAVATGRDSNTTNIIRMLDRETNYDFGLTLGDGWNYDRVLALMADRVGIDPDLSRTEGPDTISTERCLAALDRMADAIAAVAARRGSVLLATGHPTGLLVVHQAVARALRAVGCRVITAGDERPVPIENRPVKVLYVPDVAVLATRAHLLHTHRPEPMRTVLASLDGPPRPGGRRPRLGRRGRRGGPGDGRVRRLQRSRAVRRRGRRQGRGRGPARRQRLAARTTRR